MCSVPTMPCSCCRVKTQKGAVAHRPHKTTENACRFFTERELASEKFRRENLSETSERETGVFFKRSERKSPSETCILYVFYSSFLNKRERERTCVSERGFCFLGERVQHVRERACKRECLCERVVNRVRGERDVQGIFQCSRGHRK